MGLFEKIFKKPGPRVNPDGYFRLFNGYTPAFADYGGALYEQELVRAAIHAKASHISKLQVRVTGAAKPKLQTMLRQGPNEFQTWSQFLYRVATITEVKNNCYIVPVLDDVGDITGYFPVLPQRAELVQYSGEPWLRFTLQDGRKAAMELSRVGLMTKFQYADDIRGENNAALDPTMQLISIQNQGIREGVKSAASYRFYARLNNFTNDADLAKERKLFTAQNLSADADGGGMLLFPQRYVDIHELQARPFVADAAQMEMIRKNVFDYFGVNEAVLQASAMGEALDAFYNGSIEPFAVQLADVMTRMTYTPRERAAGAAVQVNANRLQYMTVSEKVNLATQLGDRGMILIDEIRDLFNYPPLPDGAGLHAPIRGEYYFTDDDKKDGEA